MFSFSPGREGICENGVAAVLYLQSAEDAGQPLLQVVPALVPVVGHLPQAAGGVGAVLPGQASVLLVDQLQLGQALVDLPLEGLETCKPKHTSQASN